VGCASCPGLLPIGRPAEAGLKNRPVLPGPRLWERRYYGVVQTVQLLFAFLARFLTLEEQILSFDPPKRAEKGSFSVFSSTISVGS
jgi:hypothetical protein